MKPEEHQRNVQETPTRVRVTAGRLAAMTSKRTFSDRFGFRGAAIAAALAITLAACGSDGSVAQTDAPTTVSAPISEPPSATDAPPATVTLENTAAPPTTDAVDRVLRIGAIPDQDPEKLARLYELVSVRLGTALDAEVEYMPVTDYAAAVTLFATGDLDLVWFGGLTGVQARLQTPGSEVIAQRDIDERFQSVFIANVDAGIAPIGDVAELSVFADRRFTFGSESSTSGRLMPQFFLDQAGIEPDSLSGEAGFSGSHDATVDLVESGSFEGGALNLQVWERRLSEATVDTSKVVEIFRTPTYHDYHWLLHSSVAERYGTEFRDLIQDTILSLSTESPHDAAILELFGAAGFIPSDASNYTDIEQIGRTLGLITE